MVQRQAPAWSDKLRQPRWKSTKAVGRRRRGLKDFLACLGGSTLPPGASQISMSRSAAMYRRTLPGTTTGRKIPNHPAAAAVGAAVV